MKPILERDLKRSPTQAGVYIATFEDGRILFIFKVEQEGNQFTQRKTHLHVRAVILTGWFWEIQDPQIMRAYTSPSHKTRREALATANAFVAEHAIGIEIPDIPLDEAQADAAA